MEAKASMKYARTSPRKMRRVIELIRGQHVESFQYQGQLLQRRLPVRAIHLDVEEKAVGVSLFFDGGDVSAA